MTLGIVHRIFLVRPNKVEVIPGISDHEAVFIESSLRPLKVKVPPRKVFNIH
jgi:dihydroorotase